MQEVTDARRHGSAGGIDLKAVGELMVSDFAGVRKDLVGGLDALVSEGGRGICAGQADVGETACRFEAIKSGECVGVMIWEESMEVFEAGARSEVLRGI